MCKTIRFFGLFFLIIFLVQSSQLLGIDRAENTKQSLSHDDYDSWKSIYRHAISNDGKWALYLETPQDGEAELVVINLKRRDEYRHVIGYSGEGTDAERTARAEFNSDATKVLFLISPSQAEVKEAKKEKKTKDKDKPKKKLGIMDLSSGKVVVIERIKSFLLPEDSPNWGAYLKEALPEAEKKEEEKEEKKTEEKEEEKEDKKKDKKRKYGTSLILRSFKDGAETEFTDVLAYYFYKNGKKLFYIVSSKDKPETDGVYMVEPGKDRSVPLLSGKGIYSKFAMNKDETCIAFLTDRDDQESKKPYFNLYGWEEGEAKASLWVSHTLQSNFPEGMAVSDKSDISFCEDGRIVMFGIKDIPAPKNEEDEDEDDEEAKFDLWHWDDPYPQPQQKLMADEVRDNTWESVYHLSSKSFVKLADKEIPDVQLSDNGKVAFARTTWPYAKRVAYYGEYYDVYVINPQTGKKTLVKKELYGRASLSPLGKYVYWFLKGDWFVYDIASGTTKNITESIDIDFEQYDWDRPNPKGSYGIAGWTDDDAAILLNDRYDIWEISPDGSSSRMITEGYGRSHGLSMRYVRLDPDEKTINPRKSILLKAVDQNTMAEGFFRERVDGHKKPVKLMMLDRMIRPFIKAKKEDRFLYACSTFEEYPDLWTCDDDFRKPEKITDLGRQMEPFIWGKSEMRDFLSADGKPLKGILVKPENFDQNKKYPLMVYIYETLHQGRHSYRHPSPGSSINLPYYVSNGYILWMPDIEYDTGYPGRDALKCVLPGIHMLIREGYIDPEAIGIQGHSWGGYQIAYMITQTNIFAASVAGAPVSNMTSAYGGIRWGSGMVRQFQYERTQSRLGDTLWKVPLRYIENSPLFWADKIQTPVMYMHNDEDGAVPWYQGIEFIMALRRLEREAYMFNYNGEAHGLRKRINQEDWTIRMAEFFDHHLKGAPMPDWMKSGIKAWEKEKNEVK